MRALRLEEWPTQGMKPSDRLLMRQRITITGGLKTGVAYVGYDNVEEAWLDSTGIVSFHNKTKTLHVKGGTTGALVGTSGDGDDSSNAFVDSGNRKVTVYVLANPMLGSTKLGVNV